MTIPKNPTLGEGTLDPNEPVRNSWEPYAGQAFTMDGYLWVVTGSGVIVDGSLVWDIKSQGPDMTIPWSESQAPLDWTATLASDDDCPF